MTHRPDQSQCNAFGTHNGAQEPRMNKHVNWWFSSNGERFHPAKSRAHAISEVEQSGGYIGAGDPPEIKLGDYISGDAILEHAEDCASDVADPDGDGLFSSITDDQLQDLEKRLRNAVDNWQAHHNLTFTQWVISWTEGPHEIAKPLTEPEFVERFTAHCILIAGSDHFNDGTSIIEYCTEVAPNYFRDQSSRDEGPEACAEGDMDCWENA